MVQPQSPTELWFVAITLRLIRFVLQQDRFVIASACLSFAQSGSTSCERVALQAIATNNEGSLACWRTKRDDCLLPLAGDDRASNVFLLSQA